MFETGIFHIDIGLLDFWKVKKAEGRKNENKINGRWREVERRESLRKNLFRRKGG
jgi:hypothetical protein